MSDSARIRSSFDLVKAQLDAIVATFYQRLFDTHPEVRTLFPLEMARQRSHLAVAISLVVKHADDLEPIRSTLEEIGARHVTYGAERAHYGIVRDTLVASLAEHAGSAWTPELERAWSAALDRVSAVMLDGAAAWSARV